MQQGRKEVVHVAQPLVSLRQLLETHFSGRQFADYSRDFRIVRREFLEVAKRLGVWLPGKHWLAFRSSSSPRQPRFIGLEEQP